MSPDHYSQLEEEMVLELRMNESKDMTVLSAADHCFLSLTACDSEPGRGRHQVVEREIYLSSKCSYLLCRRTFQLNEARI